MMRGRDKARLKHLALAAREPFTMSSMVSAWISIFGTRGIPTKPQLSNGLKELRVEGVIEMVGRDENHRQLWFPVRD